MADTVRLPGLDADKLLGYLGGLGLLRVVARQADPAARAGWAGGSLTLDSELDAEGIVDFLLNRWVPAPVVSPWNGGSGFFPKDNATAFRAIEADDSPRLDPFRHSITAARAALHDLGLSAKPEPKLAKPHLFRRLRATLADDALEWIDAAVVLVGDAPAYPPVLGSGGNDGRYDVANNYAQAVVFALGLESGIGSSADALQSALWATPGVLRPMSLAHLSRDASPVNSPTGESDALGNPWHLILAVEGTLVLAAGAGRRLADGASPGLIAPFTLRATGAGYGSAVAGEKGKAELWLPLWRQPASFSEVEALFREARAQVGRRTATTGLDAARAAGELGVARGIDAFQRFSILERAGLSNLAVPAGIIQVRPRPAAQALSTLDPWLGRVLAYGRGDIPQGQRLAIGAVERTAFAVAELGTPRSIEELLIAIGDLESVFAAAAERSRPGGLNPIAPDAHAWVESLDGTNRDLRLSVGLGSAWERMSGARLPSLRDYWHGTAFDDRGRRKYGIPLAGQVPTFAGAAERLAAAHERRHQDASRATREDLGWSRGIPVALADMAAFAAGDIDGRRVGSLVGGLALLDYTRTAHPRWASPSASPDPLLSVLALVFHDPRLRDVPPPDRRGLCRPLPGWVARLRAGQVGFVVGEALLRLRLSGRAPIPTVDDLQIQHADGQRLAAALLAQPRLSDVRRASAALTIAEADNQTEEIPE